MLLLLALLISSSLGQIPWPVYSPSGPRVRLQVVTDTNQVLYIKSEANDIAKVTSSQESATVFTYDAGKQNAFFLADKTGAPSGWLLLQYHLDDSGSGIYFMDEEAALNPSPIAPYRPLRCTPTAAGSNTLTCQHEGIAGNAYCIEHAPYDYVNVYNSDSYSRPEDFCGARSRAITSIRLEYVVDPATTTYTNSSSPQVTSELTSEPPTSVTSGSPSSEGPRTKSSSSTSSTSESSTTAGFSTPSRLGSAFSVDTTSSTRTQSTSIGLNSQSSSLVPVSSTGIPTSYTSGLSTTSRALPTSELAMQSSRGNEVTSTLPYSVSKSDLSEIRYSGVTVSSISDQTTTSNELFSDTSTTSLLPKPTSAGRTSNLVSSTTITTVSSSQEQVYASSTADNSKLSIINSPSLMGTISIDHGTSRPNDPASTIQPVPSRTSTAFSQTFASVFLPILSSPPSSSSSYAPEQQTTPAIFGSDSSSLATPQSSQTQVTSILVNSLSSFPSTPRVSSQSITALPTVTQAREIIGIEMIYVITPRELLQRRQGESTGILSIRSSILDQDERINIYQIQMNSPRRSLGSYIGTFLWHLFLDSRTIQLLSATQYLMRC